jgi:hypothetical protein
MALLYGFDDHDTFEWELSRQELSDSGMAFFSMNNCTYNKFPDTAAIPR